MQRLLTILLLVLLRASVATASGWNDFGQPIGDGYSIVRANASDIVLCRGSIVVVGSTRGPLVAYAVTPTHILTKHERLPSQSFYIVQKQPEQVTGPLSVEGFAASPVVSQLGTVSWSVPTNPHPEVARAGQRMFVGFMILFFGGPLVLVVLILCLRWWLRHRSRTRGRLTAG